MVFSWDDFVAGCIGGTAGLLVGHPADTIKIRQQTLHTRLLPTIAKTYKHEGIRGFYKGLLFPLIGTGPLNAMFFGVYSNCMRLFNHDGKIDRVATENPDWMWHVFVAGCAGGFSTLGINCPIEVVKTTLQARTEGSKTTWKQHYTVPYDGMWSCIKGIYKERGWQAFYKGGLPLMLRDVPSFGIYALSYEAIEHWRALAPIGDTWKCILAGGVAGVLSWVLILPFDFVKSRMQTDDPLNPNYKGMMDCIRKCHAEGGCKIFWNGTSVVALRAFPVNVAVFFVYERSLAVMDHLFHGEKFAGLISWTVIMPLDVVKSRIQTDDPFKPRYTGMLDCFRKSYRAEGWTVFVRGYRVVAVRAFPVNAAVFFAYEESFKFLQGVSVVRCYE